MIKCSYFMKDSFLEKMHSVDCGVCNFKKQVVWSGTDCKKCVRGRIQGFLRKVFSALFLCLFVAFGSSMVVNAENPNVCKITDFSYSFGNDTTVIKSSHSLVVPVIWNLSSGDFNYQFVFFSNSPDTLTFEYYKKDTLTSSGEMTLPLSSVNSSIYSYTFGFPSSYIVSQNIIFNYVSSQDELDSLLLSVFNNYSYWSGELNVTQDDSFYLTGFQCDNVINASWTGSTLEGDVSPVDTKIFLKADYSLKSAPTQVAQKHVFSTKYEISDMSLSVPFEDLKEADNDLYLFHLYFQPYYTLSSGDVVYGKCSSVYFNPDGTISKIEADTYKTLSKDIPTPSISVVPTPSGSAAIPSSKTSFVFQCNNSTDDYYIEVQGRWYTVDDIELYKEKAMWKYKYNTILKSNLNTWLSTGKKAKASNGFDAGTLGQHDFDLLLQKYPVDSRSYTGGTNSLGNYFSGYNDALSTLKTVLLPTKESLMNGLEIYVRYYVINEDGSTSCGKWCHWFNGVASSSGSSGSLLDSSEEIREEHQSESGLTDNDKEQLENSGNSKGDSDAQKDYDENPFGYDSMTDALGSFSDIMNDFGSFLGSVPSFVARCFGFLPWWVNAMIGLAIGVVIILRVVGR